MINIFPRELFKIVLLSTLLNQITREASVDIKFGDDNKKFSYFLKNLLIKFWKFFWNYFWVYT